MTKGTPDMPWRWFTEKVLPGLFLAVAVSMGGTAFVMWRTVDKLSYQINSQEVRLNKLEVQIANSVTRNELLETLKRVEQQLQIVLLQAGIRQKVELK
jgi:short-subunit dehydrogenase involved in D-alanine esterification of teichoic acids